jgi:hypothetical protein
MVVRFAVISLQTDSGSIPSKSDTLSHREFPFLLLELVLLRVLQRFLVVITHELEQPEVKTNNLSLSSIEVKKTRIISSTLSSVFL